MDLKASTILAMKMTAIIILLACLQVSAKSFGQRVTLSVKNASLEKIFSEIERQTGYDFIYFQNQLDKTRSIDLEAVNLPLDQTLDLVFKDQPLTYSIEKNFIVIRQKPAPVPAPPSADNAPPPPTGIHGRITDSTGQPLEGATIQVRGTRRVATSDENGEFTLKEIGPDDILVISFVGYGTRLVPVKGQKSISILLHVTSSDLANVEVAYSNGYQQIPKERATGSFDFIDNKLINREVTTNILDRLDGIANSVLFDHRIGNGVISSNGSVSPGILIRGFSTINSVSQPLLVLDGAPYYGDPALINPNDVETITILKDAAAASIWGAQAGNGVIVITTKKGRLDQPLQIGVVSNISITGKPLIKDNPNFMNSNDFINLEEYLFGQGFYNANLTSSHYPVISPVVNLLNEAQTGVISNQAATDSINALRNVDVRNGLLKYFFQNQVSQQYAVNLSGGSDRVSYYLSTGYDKILSNSAGSNNDRLTFNSANTFHLVRNLELGLGLTYTQTNAEANNSNIGSSTPFPYTQLVDSKGNPIPIAYGYSNSYIQQAQQGGYLNWQFNPLQELREDADITTGKGMDIKINPSIKYTFIPGLSAVLNYQYETTENTISRIATEQSYFTRNLINQYTNLSATNPHPIPLGDILINGSSGITAQSGRGQINYGHRWNRQSFNAIAGGEITDYKTNGNSGNYVYGYNQEGYGLPVDYVDNFPINPSSGSVIIPGGVPSISATESRTISAFANASYTYDNRYTVSASARKDASNLFGVSANNKWKPLWSGGFKWQLSNENFYKSNILPNLALRMTYGYSGNIDNSISAVTTIVYSNYPSNYTNYPIARLVNSPNPNLSWESVSQLNLAIDFGSQKNRIVGSVDFYKKYCSNLIAPIPIDPTSGVGIFPDYINENSADLKTQGIDIAVNSRNLVGKFKWETTVNFNYVTDDVTRYLGYGGAPTESNYVGAKNSPYPIVGRTLESVYSYKWGGLDAVGNPQGYLNGKLSENYQGIMSDSVKNMVFKGSSTPILFGNVLNTFYWHRVSLSANIAFRLDYWIQKPTISYTSLLQGISSGNSGANIDYDKRWQNPGDEKHTTVPSFDYPANSYRDQFYAGAEPNFLRGDNIRLQDIRLGYDLPGFHKAVFKSLTVYAYSSNSLLIWRANKADIDPNYLTISPSKAIAIGVNATF